VFIKKNLNLDMARVFDVAFTENSRISKVTSGFTGAGCKCIGKLFRRSYDAHASTASAS
jgi:hypothetical protein